MCEIDDLRSKLEKLAPQSEEAQKINQLIQAINESIHPHILKSTRSEILEQEISSAKQKLWVRLAMALGGRLAIVDGDHGLASHVG